MITHFQRIKKMAICLHSYHAQILLSSKRFTRPGLPVSLVVIGLLIFPAQLQAVTTTVLHSFGDGSVANDGNSVATSLIQATDGNFYGIANTGGAANEGIAFKTTSAGTVTILHSFGDGSITNDGTYPQGALVRGTDGNFYGVTGAGGSANKGAAFKMTSTGTMTILHSFGDGSVTNDGNYPEAALIQATDGNFYGTTYAGGSANKGVIFKMTSSGTVTILHHLGTITNDGAYPFTSLVQGTDGNFYAATYLGGSANDGTVLKMTLSGTVTILHSFGSVTNDGTVPEGSLVQAADGNFYGTTLGGGTANDGTVFKITSNGTLTILHNFHDGSVTNDGMAPSAGLFIASDGNFYGTTAYGGSGTDGTVFKITPGGTETIIHNFGDGSVSSDGHFPLASVIQGTDGNFYGTTLSGGSASDGVIFKISMYTVLHNFNDGSVAHDGFQPVSAMILASDGNFYGTTNAGGAYSARGTAFKMSSTGTITILHSFGGVTSDGSFPNAGLVQASDGNFYGTTTTGGSPNYGTIFKMTSTGTVTILHTFGDGSVTNDGLEPYAGLAIGSDGNFYGTTEAGGSNYGGVVFKITPTGTYTILHNFNDGSVSGDGRNPGAGLVKGSDGNFYGTTTSGGSASFYGCVFKITPSGTVTILHSFKDGSVSNDGYDPYASLIQGLDGNFYGTTVDGGSAAGGTFFKITSTGTVTILHSFGDGTVTNDGDAPYAGVVQSSNGNFYGTTYLGGSVDSGTVFKITPTGTTTILHSFGSFTNDGSKPVASLVFGSDGDLYGVTWFGGTQSLPDDGTAFMLLP